MQKDNFSSIHQWLNGKDFGGWAAGAPAHIAGAGALAAQNALSIQARITRGDTFLSLLKTNILDQDIIDAIDDYFTNVLPGMAPRAVAAGGPGGAAVAGQHPTDWGMQLWLWIGLTYGDLAQNGLLRSNQGNTWTNFKLTDVGIDKDTLRRFHAELLRKNRERQVPYAAIDVWTKFMENITFPRLLHDEATRQLQNPTFLNAAGNPDLNAALTSFEQIWHKIWDEGKELQYKAAPKSADREISNRVDGMQNEQSFMLQAAPQLITMPAMMNASSPQLYPNATASSPYISNYVWSGVSHDDLLQAFILPSTGHPGEAFAFLKDERNCWRCRGWGHEKDKCPSSERKRPVAAAIQGLQEIQQQGNARLRNMQRGQRLNVVRRPGNYQRPAARPNAHSNEANAPDDTVITVYQYEDGTLVSEDGTIWNPTATADNESESSLSLSTQVVGPQAPAGPKEASANEDSAPARPNTAPEPEPTITSAAVNAAVEAEFNSSLQSFSVQSQDDEYEYTEPPRPSFIRKAAVAAGAATIAVLIGAVALAKSPKSRALLTLLACTAPTAALSTGSDAKYRVHASVYSKSQAFISGGATRDNAIMDSGTTKGTSGRKKLFPIDKIQEWHPRIKVEVASGVTLPVVFRGVMRLMIRPINSRSAKKKFPP